MPASARPGKPTAPRHPQTALGWAGALAVALIGVTWLALTPQPPSGLDTGWDKGNHVLAFAVLAWLAWRAVAAWTPARAPAIAALVGLLAHGGLIELLQRQVPGRAAEWSDLAADAIGLAVGALVARFGPGRPRWD